MSYSFTVRGDNADNAKEKAAAQMDQVVEAQPIHERDRAFADDAIAKAIDLLDDDGRAIQLSVTGSVMGEKDKLYHVSLTINASLVNT